MSNNSNKRIVFFDILRIFAIFLVVLGHLAQATGIPYLNKFYGIPNFYWVSIAGFGVTLFLIVSGSALAYNHSNTIPLNEIKRFFANRIIRIYPTYWISIITVVVISLMVIPGYIHKLSFINLFLTFSGLYVYLNQWGGPIMAVSWFIGLILSLYLIYPLLNYLFNKNAIFTLLLLLFISIVSRLICGQLQSIGIGNRLIDWVPLCRVFEFGFGMYLVKSGLYINTIDVGKNLEKYIILLSNLSFPVYLIHASFFDGQIINSINMEHSIINVLVYTIIALIIITTLSFIIYTIDYYLQNILRRKRLIKR
ncbi:acyltransferase family protein [Methanocella sp. MCL-LM]|uniref:acyltransferase family protein n=1 Tax=Methanocella sp. MCL-LM TaxID=3412035 RepID=UPI003C712B89